MKILRIAVAVVFLAVFGLIKLPLELHLAKVFEAANFRRVKLDLDLREQIGQLSFLAALSGFRAMVADLLWIRGHEAWENTEWAKMAALFRNVTTLQPRNVMFWDVSAWHIGWNASVAAYDNPSEPRHAIRLKAQREYFELGKEILEHGIKNNPDRAALYQTLGRLYIEKYKDHCSAAEAFDRGAACEDAPAYLKRMAAYACAACPGREREAYDRMKRLYQESEKNHTPTLLRLLQELSDKLGVPQEQRVYTGEE